MTRAYLFAPAGEVGSLGRADVDATIDSAIAAVDFAVEPVTIDVGAAVDGGAAGHPSTVTTEADSGHVNRTADGFTAVYGEESTS